MTASGRGMGLIALALVLGGAPAAAQAPVVGQPAPAFRVTLLDGTKLSLDDMKGQVIVLNFWATWCVPCKVELPLLNGYYKLQQPAGLRVLAVTTEDSVPIYRLKPLAALLTIPLVRFMRGSYAPIGGAVPTNFIIDRAGIVRYAKASAFTLDDMNTIIGPLLAEAAPLAAVQPAAAVSTARQ